MKAKWHEFLDSSWFLPVYLIVFMACFYFIVFHFHLAVWILAIGIPLIIIKLIFHCLTH